MLTSISPLKIKRDVIVVPVLLSLWPSPESRGPYGFEGTPHDPELVFALLIEIYILSLDC